MTSDTAKQESIRRGMEHIWHVWINRRQDERRKAGADHEHDLYEWKNAIEEMRRLPYWLKAAREGTLRTDHQQCSHSATEPIAENRLMCALGVDVTACPILASLYATFAEETKIDFYNEITPDDTDQIAAYTCAWHIFTERQKNPGLDTSEGYVQDESDRRFWSNVYENLSRASDDESADDVPAYLGPGHFPLPVNELKGD